MLRANAVEQRSGPALPCPGGRRPAAGSPPEGRRRSETETAGATGTRTDHRRTTATTTHVSAQHDGATVGPDQARIYHPVRVGRQAADPLPVLRTSAALKRDGFFSTPQTSAVLSAAVEGAGLTRVSPHTCRPRCSGPTDPSGCLEDESGVVNSLTSCLKENPLQTSLTPDSHGAVFSSRQDLGLTFPHADTVHVVGVTLQNRLKTHARRQEVTTSLLQMADRPSEPVPTLNIPCSRSRTWMLLSPAPTMRLLSCPTTETTGHHAGNKTTNLKNYTHSGVEDHRVDLWDLQAGSETGSNQHHKLGG